MWALKVHENMHSRSKKLRAIGKAIVYRVAEFTAEAEKPTVAIGGGRVLLHVVVSDGAR